MGMLLQTRCIIINPVLNCCYQKHRKRYTKKLKEIDKDDEKTSEDRWFKIHSLDKVIHHIKQTENENPGRIFEVKQLENISRFGDTLKEKLPGIEFRNVGKKPTL